MVEEDQGNDLKSSFIRITLANVLKRGHGGRRGSQRSTWKATTIAQATHGEGLHWGGCGNCQCFVGKISFADGLDERRGCDKKRWEESML